MSAAGAIVLFSSLKIKKFVMQIINQSVSFSAFSGSGPQSTNTSVSFPSAITQVTAVLTGFLAEFSGGNDHHLGLLEITLNVGSISGGTDVPVTIQYGLRDWSGNWDDQYDGQVFFTVIGV
jgi:hypothetical protein